MLNEFRAVVDRWAAGEDVVDILRDAMDAAIGEEQELYDDDPPGAGEVYEVELRQITDTILSEEPFNFFFTDEGADLIRERFADQDFGTPPIGNPFPIPA